MLQKLKIEVRKSDRIVALLSILTLALTPLFWPLGTVSAAALTSVSDTLSNSAPATVSNHTIEFVTPTGVLSASQTITLTFDSSPGFTGVSGIDDTDIDIAYDDDDACDAFGTEISLAAAADATNWGAASSGQVVTLTHSTDGANQDIPANRCVQVQIGTNATNQVTGLEQITNPTKVAAAGTADVMTMDIAGTFGDTGTAMVATIEGTTVSVTVDESLSFTVAGVAAGSCTGDTGTPSPTVIDTSGNPSTVPFGTVATNDAFYAACQLLSIDTNASAGYSLTAQEDTSLQSGSVEIPDGDCDGTCNETTGSTWATNSNYGFGYFCDPVGGGAACHSAGDTTSEYRVFACTGAAGDCSNGGSDPPVTIMTDTAPTNNDDARVHFKISVDPTQAAGTYDNTVTYIATPTF